MLLPSLLLILVLLLAGSTAQQPTLDCRTPFNEEGSCVLRNECDTLQSVTDAAVLRKFICGYKRQKPKLCCPPTSQEGKPFDQLVTPEPDLDEDTTEDVSTTTISSVIGLRGAGGSGASIAPLSEQPPHPEYPSNLPAGCGISNVSISKVVGGRVAEPGAWPWVVALYVKTSGNDKVTCGGALVSERHVVTAAHCVALGAKARTLHPRYLTVRLGDHDLSTLDDNTAPIDVDVSSIKRHPRYDPRRFTNDIAVLTLAQPVTFNFFVRPLCLPFGPLKDLDIEGYHGFLVGWGATSFEGSGSHVLREVQIPIWGDGECRTVFQRHVPIANTQLCAGDTRGKKDACQGDSGGPFVLPHERRFYLVGIVSSGRDCASPGFPGIYTRVTSYLDWLKEALQ